MTDGLKELIQSAVYFIVIFQKLFYNKLIFRSLLLRALYAIGTDNPGIAIIWDSSEGI